MEHDEKLLEKVKNIRTAEELVAVAKENGIEFTEKEEKHILLS